jgi:hypothetical protein
MLPEDRRSHLFERRWQYLCVRYLPVFAEGSIWRLSRESTPDELSQGWKLHISAIILNACEVLEIVGSKLGSQNIQFKAPRSLEELSRINCGLQYGYWQVGKFITVYPSSAEQAVALARELHLLTAEFSSVQIPFDNQYLPDSSVFYRYGAFKSLEMTDPEGRAVSGLRDPKNQTVYDDRLRPVPDWMLNPFPAPQPEKCSVPTPFTSSYKVFRAITQRGKGGVYQAIDLTADPPRLCVIKEGRRLGEVSWDGRDGYELIRNEWRVLEAIQGSVFWAPLKWMGTSILFWSS